MTSNLGIQDNLLEGTSSRGLGFLNTVISIKNHEQLVIAMAKNLCWPDGIFLGRETLEDEAQDERRRVTPSERDRKQERRDPMPFKGDVELDADGSHPPLCWTLIWGGTYSNLYGFYIDNAIRHWGYVFLDAARVERTGAKDLLMRQWNKRWENSDPRDGIM